MDEDVANVRKFDATEARRNVPFFLYLVGKVEHAVQRLPLRAAILTAKETNGTHAQVDDSFVVRIDRKGTDVTLHDFFPCLAAVLRPIAAVESDSGKNDFRVLKGADQMLQRFAAEEFADGVERARAIIQDLQSAVMRDVITQWFIHHCLLYSRIRTCSSLGALFQAGTETGSTPCTDVLTHRLNWRPPLVPPAVLLVGIRRTQNCRLVKRFTDELQRDRKI